jgi:hypothetical protein
MALSYDTQTNANISAGTLTHAGSAIANAVIAYFGIGAGPVTGVTYDGIAMTEIKTITHAAGSYSSMWWLLGAVGGTKTLAWTPPGGAEGRAGCVTLIGAGGYGGTSSASQNGGAVISVAQASVDGYIVIDGSHAGNIASGASYTPNQTVIWTDGSDPQNRAEGQQRAAGAASVTMQWTCGANCASTIVTVSVSPMGTGNQVVWL